MNFFSTNLSLDPSHTPILLFLGQLIALSWSSRQLQRQLHHLVSKTARHHKLTLWLTAGLFLPGTIIHELAHFLSARLLLVSAKNFSVWPSPQADGTLRLGSVQIPSTDPIRQALIALAPLPVGLTLLILLLSWIQSQPYLLNPASTWLIWLGLLYAIFQLLNTMFPSPTDLKLAWPAALVAAALITLIYWQNWLSYASLTDTILPTINPYLSLASSYLWWLLVFNIFLLLITRLFIRR